MNDDSHFRNHQNRMRVAGATSPTRRAICTRMAWTSLVGCLANVLLVTSTLFADAATARFYDQLRQRNLFSLVEADCLQRLAVRSLSDRDRGDLVLELSRTYAAHAWLTVGSEQDDLWSRGKQVLADYLEQNPRPARRELFDVQLALIDLGQAEWSLAQAELRPDDRVPRQRGLSAAQAAIDRLTRLEKSVGKEVRPAAPTSSNNRSGADAASEIPLTLHERRALWQQVRLRLGIARLVQAKLSPTPSADRAAALVAADEWLLPLAAATSGERVNVEGQLALAEIARLRNDLGRAAALLTTIEKTLSADTPNDLRERLVIERVRWWLAKGQPAEAASFLIEQRQEAGGRNSTSSGQSNVTPSHELAYWQIAVELALWRVASARGDAALVKDLAERTQTQVAKLEQKSGGYWASRARFDWQAARDTQKYGSQLVALITRARNAFADGQTDEALALYDEAIAAAKVAKHNQLLLELADTRASLLFQAQRFDEAAAAFRKLADAPRHERSTAAHLLWAFCLGKIFDKQPTDEHRTAFAQSLQSLIERYPAESEAAEATWLLGQIAERQRHFNDAMKLYASIPAKHARRDDAWAAIARCHERLIKQLRADQQPTADAEEAAISQLVPAARAVLDLKSSEANGPQAELLVRLARLLMERHPPDEKSADRLLQYTIATSSAAEWRKAAEQLRVVSLAGQRRIDEAEKLLDSLEESGPDELLSLLDGLTSVAAACDSGTQRLVAELQLRALQDLAVSTQQELSAAQRLRLWQVRAEAYAATGQTTKAIAASLQLLEKLPRDPKRLRSTAELSEMLESSDGNKQAKSLWRRLETLLKPGSAEWLDARWHVIRCCQKLGEQAEADKLLKVTKLLYPDLDGPAMRAKFDSL